MLVSIFGTPSPLTYWTLHAVRILAQALYSDHLTVHAFRPDDVWSNWKEIGSSSVPVIVFSDCPEGALCDLMLTRGSPLILVAEDTQDIVSFLVDARGMRVQHALRLLSQCASSLEILCGRHAVWTEDTSRYDSTVRDHISWLGSFCGYAASEDQIEGITSRLVEHSSAHTHASVGELVTRTIPKSCLPGTYDVLDGAASELTANVGDQYAAILRNRRVDRLVWPREIFPNFDRPDDFLNGPQAMLGPARYLVLGPYFHLPRGDWVVRVEIEVEENLSGNEIRAELLCGETLIKGITAVLPPRGVFSFQMELAVAEPFLPIEVRIQMLRGAIEGIFLLRSVQFSRRTGNAQLPLLGALNAR